MGGGENVQRETGPPIGPELERLERLYAARSEIGEAVMQALSRDELFRRVCDVLVERGGLRMAWLGLHDPETRRLLPIAEVGDKSGYLATLEIYSDDRVEGRGPTGRAFRDNRPYICNDMLADAATVPWREKLAICGFLSSAAFPILTSAAVVGVLSVYAGEPGFFRDKEITLLSEAAAEVSFALDSLRHRDSAEREQRFASGLIEAMPGIFYLYDRQGRFVRWNHNFERISGYSGHEIAKMHPLDFFSADERPLLQQRINQAFESGKATVEAALLSKGGAPTPHFFTGKRIVLDGQPHLVGVGVDISERKAMEQALEKSEQRYRSTLDSILESCQLIDFDWRYLYLNPAAAIQNRRPNDELLGRTMHEAWPGIEATGVYGLLQRCMVGRAAERREIAFAFADGSTGWFDVHVQPVAEGVFVLSNEVSERRRAERALRELNESLERKVVERTIDLAAASERAEEADRIKSAFLASMSHELRTPLNSILGFTGIVLKGMAGPLTEEQAKQLGMVQGSARHLLDLINDVLDISKIEAGQLEARIAPFDLASAVERAVASVKPLAERKGLGLRASLPPDLPPIESDRRRVAQILLNLLNNAIKFSDRGGVVLDVALSDDKVRVRIEDTGIGIKQADLEKLFRPFQQVDAGLQRQHEGTGLGLAICRSLTEMLGGTIAVTSVWGQGSVFTVELPIKRSRAS
jgi:PAS domain S-box-containing protein